MVGAAILAFAEHLWLILRWEQPWQACYFYGIHLLILILVNVIPGCIAVAYRARGRTLERNEAVLDFLAIAVLLIVVQVASGIVWHRLIPPAELRSRALELLHGPILVGWATLPALSHIDVTGQWRQRRAVVARDLFGSLIAVAAVVWLEVTW